MVASSAAGKLRQVIVRNAATVVTDQELWRQLRTAGADDAVWEAAVARWTPAVRQVARRATRDPGTADDLVQEAFTALFRAVRDGQLREVTCARSWLGVVTCHLASRFRKPNRKVSPLDAAADVGAPSHSELAARRVEEADLVHQEIANLPDKYRTAVLLCDISEADRAAVARQLNITTGALNRRLSRARGCLEAMLRRRGVTAAVAAALAAPRAEAVDVRPLTDRITAVIQTLLADPTAAGPPTTAVWAWSAKLKCTAGVAVAVVAVSLAVVGLSGSGRRGEPPPPAVAPADAPDDDPPPVVPTQFEVSFWRPDAKLGKNVYAGKLHRNGSNVVPQRRDLFAWDVAFDAPHPCHLLHVRPDGSLRPLSPTGEGEVPEADTTFRYPDLKAHDGNTHEIGEAGNQALVLVVQKRAAAFTPPAAPLPWRAVPGEGMWYYEPTAGMKELTLFNKLAFRRFNRDTGDPVAAVAAFFEQQPNVRAVFAFGLTVRP